MWRQRFIFPEKDLPFFTYGKPTPVFFFPCRQVSKFRQKKITVANPLTYLTKLKKQNKNRAYNPSFCGLFLVF